MNGAKVTLTRPFELQADDLTQGQILSLLHRNPSTSRDAKHADGDIRRSTERAIT